MPLERVLRDEAPHIMNYLKVHEQVEHIVATGKR